MDKFPPPIDMTSDLPDTHPGMPNVALLTASGAVGVVVALISWASIPAEARLVPAPGLGADGIVSPAVALHSSPPAEPSASQAAEDSPLPKASNATLAPVKAAVSVPGPMADPRRGDVPPASTSPETDGDAALNAAFTGLTGSLLPAPTVSRFTPTRETRKNFNATVQALKASVGPQIRARLDAAGIAGKPKSIVLVVFKAERRVELWADDRQPPVLLAVYPLLVDDGEDLAPGPKRRRGDGQMPEGLYAMSQFEFNSTNHLGLQIRYPNRADKVRALAEGRKGALGGGMSIRGGTGGANGSFPIGNAAIEEVVYLAHLVGAENVRLISVPWDLRRKAPPTDEVNIGPWMRDFYADLARQLAAFPEIGR